MRRFYLKRLEDDTGVSGTGRIAEGIEFDDGSVILTWNTVPNSIAIYASIPHVTAIHGHGGRTVVEYIDDDLFDVYPDFLDSEPDALKYLQL